MDKDFAYWIIFIRFARSTKKTWGENRNCIAVTALCFYLRVIRCRRAAQLVVLVRHARPSGLTVSQRFLQRVTFTFFYASVAGYPAGHRVNRSFGPCHHAGAVDPTQTGELTDNFLTCQVEWCYLRRLWDSPARLPPP